VYVECRGPTFQLIAADTQYAVLASQAVFDQWRYCAAGEHYLGYDDTDIIPTECPTHAGSTLTAVGLDEVPWRIPRANRQALRTWLMAKGVPGTKAREILQDLTADDLDANEIRRLAKAYLEALPVAAQAPP
jgi:hypothetical protein